MFVESFIESIICDTLVRIVYKNRDVVGWVYIAKKVDDTEIIYYETMEQMLDFMKKTKR